MTNLYQSLLKAQADMPPVRESSRNPHFGSRYADLETVLSTVTPVLRKHGLLIWQGPGFKDGQRILTTVLAHAESGDTITSHCPLVSKDPDNPQALGGAITYARRYGVLSILGIATEDDDANAASAQPVRRPDPGDDRIPAAASVRGSAPSPDRPQAAPGTGITPPQIKFINQLAEEKGILDSVDYWANQWYGTNVESLERRDASAMIDKLKDFVADKKPDEYAPGPFGPPPFEQAPSGASSRNPVLVQPGSNAESGMNEGARKFWINKIHDAVTTEQLNVIESDIRARFGYVDNAVAAEIYQMVAALAGGE